MYALGIVMYNNEDDMIVNHVGSTTISLALSGYNIAHICFAVTIATVHNFYGIAEFQI